MVLLSLRPCLKASKTTPYYKRTTPVLLRTTKYYSSTTKYYSVLQSTTPVLLRPKRRQNDVHPVLLRTTKYYSSTTLYYKVLPRTTKYYSSTTPYYKRTTPYYKRTTPYYRVLVQYYSVLQSSTKASKRSISCQASSTFQGTSFQNEHFVRDILNFSKNKLPKRAFRARLRQLFTQQASKTSISCEASSTFQATNFQNEYFARSLFNFSSNKLPKRAFRARPPQLFNQGASKVLPLPRKTRK